MRQRRLAVDWVRPAPPPIRPARALARLPSLFWRLGRAAFGTWTGRGDGGDVARHVLGGLGVELEWVGEPIPDGPAVVVSNHLGWLDPMILRSRIPGHYVAKREVSEWPVIGPWTRSIGGLYVDRDRPLRARAFVDEAVGILRSGGRVVGFPEGSSTDYCRVLPFKTGMFQAAIEAEVPVLPVRIELVRVGDRVATARWRQAACWFGTAELAPHLWWTLGSGQLGYRVRVGSPVPSQGWHRKRLARAVRTMILRHGSDVPGGETLRSSA